MRRSITMPARALLWRHLRWRSVGLMQCHARWMQGLIELHIHLAKEARLTGVSAQRPCAYAADNDQATALLQIAYGTGHSHAR